MKLGGTPIKEYTQFLCGYFNDDGINMMHDNFFHPMAKETHEESHSLADILQPAYVPVENNHKLHKLACTCNELAQKEGLGFSIRPVKEERESGTTPPSFNLVSALQHV